MSAAGDVEGEQLLLGRIVISQYMESPLECVYIRIALHPYESDHFLMQLTSAYQGHKTFMSQKMPFQVTTLALLPVLHVRPGLA